MVRGYGQKELELLVSDFFDVVKVVKSDMQVKQSVLFLFFDIILFFVEWRDKDKCL